MWQRQVGKPSVAANAVAAPEPASGLLVLAALPVFARCLAGMSI
jgi:hypothetical protein